MKIRFACVLAVVGLAAAAPAGADPPRDFVVGAGTIEADPFLGDSFSVSAHSGPLGEDPRGHVNVRTTNLAGDRQSFHGDVSEGCLIVTGNRAVAVGRLPEDERFVEPTTGRTIEFAAVIVEDNGHPVKGQPLDRAFPVLFFTATAARACAGLLPASLVTVPIDRGNVVVNDALG